MSKIADLRGVNFLTQEARIIADGYGGWEEIEHEWTCYSVGTTPVNYAIHDYNSPLTKFQKGDKVRLKHLGVYKYFYIGGVYADSLALYSGTGYVLDTTNPITEICVSAQDGPFGFPQLFDYVPTPTGFSSGPTSCLCQYGIRGGRCLLTVRQLTEGTSSANTFTIPLPIAAAATTLGLWIAPIQFMDGSTLSATPGKAAISASGTEVILTTSYASAVWTATGGKKANFSIEYPI